MKNIVTVIILTVLLLTRLNAQNNVLPFGVSLCGAEFGVDNLPGVYNVNYTYPDKDEIKYFAKKGVSVMQLPFRWERIQKTPFGPLDAGELGRMTSFLNDCAASGVMVIMNMHNFARYKMNNVEYVVGNPQVSVSAFKDFWKKMSTALLGFDNIYALDIMNEPHDMGEYSWFSAAEEAINGIRKVNKDVYVMVEGECYSNASSWPEVNDRLKNLQDPSDRIIYNAHCYFDDDYSGRYTRSYEQTFTTPQTGVENVKPFVTWLKANGKKGFVGEFGVPKNDQRWLVVLDNFLKYLTANGISGSYWAAGAWWKNYPLSLHPIAGNDQPQMGVYSKYLNTGVAYNSPNNYSSGSR